MVARRRTQGSETWARLRDWDRGQAPAERLSSHILRVEGFQNNDPSHPLGGPDGLKDIICLKDGKKWIGAAYFPRGQQAFSDIRKKFKSDLEGTQANEINGIVFVTNQELALGERKELKKIAGDVGVEIYHLERISSILDSPLCYGIRLEFLDIDMTKEEQLAFIAERDEVIRNLQVTQESIISHLKSAKLLRTISAEQVSAMVPLDEIKEFKTILDSIAGYEGYNPYSDILVHPSPYYGSGFFQKRDTHVSDLRVPLQELREFKRLIEEMVENPDPLGVEYLTYTSHGLSTRRLPLTSNLAVPLAQLQEYEKTLDRIIQKLKKKKMLET